MYENIYERRPPQKPIFQKITRPFNTSSLLFIPVNALKSNGKSDFKSSIYNLHKKSMKVRQYFNWRGLPHHQQQLEPSF